MNQREKLVTLAVLLMVFSYVALIFSIPSKKSVHPEVKEAEIIPVMTSQPDIQDGFFPKEEESFEETLITEETLNEED
ncbi:MAG: hypothetical protein ACE5E9_12165 [Nitrospinaceae bacterium]